MTKDPLGPLSRRHLAAAAAVGLLAAACTTSPEKKAADAATDDATSAAPTPTPSPTPAVVEIVPADRATDVLPNTPVTVTASVGKVRTVKVTDDQGKELAGSIDAAGNWTSSRFMKPSATYTVEVSAEGPDGTPSTQQAQFTTLKPGVTATYGINYSGMTVGVGMPVAIQFDTAVQTKEMRAQVERLATVTTEPAVEGSWGWLDNRQLMWRPKDFWVPGTKVTVSAPLAGVQTGDTKWVGKDESGGFTIGDAMISHVDVPGHTMTVTRNGQVIRTIPVSNGRPGPETETRSGTKVIIERQSEITMDSATVGIPEGSPGYYKVETKWNLRVTWTGEFLHSAPWSVDAQGTSNVSHGCTNMAPDNAEWMFNNSRAGDVVQVTGSGRTFQPTEGIGVWQYSFEDWKRQSALV
ncbi:MULTISPECIES: L,D-transpeptidase [Phycicoccus]|uniref:L,D-transpeptidase n=1 Tax=Phycicoccus TaxID=367298 RepID=UPI002B905810|nr:MULTISPECIES: Ig-like domain-containing protein [Phycicoccus]HPF75394.1 Ig-like domain-containing protein [Phycicoccus elongatus]HRV56992.1 Ig-like domain-containing protein [Phycicoccus sp.]